MTVPSNGITPEVIHKIMPPHTLSTDLLAATCSVLPPPPADATAPHRHEGIARLVGEIAGSMPATAPGRRRYGATRSHRDGRYNRARRHCQDSAQIALWAANPAHDSVIPYPRTLLRVPKSVLFST